jgi:hypothetical protein
MRITDFKHCSKCRSHKHRDEFAKNWQTKDGLNSWCRQCHKAHRIARKHSREVGSESATTALPEMAGRSARSA